MFENLPTSIKKDKRKYKTANKTAYPGIKYGASITKAFGFVDLMLPPLPETLILVALPPEKIVATACVNS